MQRHHHYFSSSLHVHKLLGGGVGAIGRRRISIRNSVLSSEMYCTYWKIQWIFRMNQSASCTLFGAHKKVQTTWLVRAEMSGYLREGTIELCRNRVAKYIVKSVGLGQFYVQILGGIEEPLVLPAIFTWLSSPWCLELLFFYKHSLCFVTAGYAVSVLWRCRVTPD